MEGDHFKILISIFQMIGESQKQLEQNRQNYQDTSMQKDKSIGQEIIECEWKRGEEMDHRLNLCSAESAQKN